jgi:hypothetical protein
MKLRTLSNIGLGLVILVILGIAVWGVLSGVTLIP